MTIKTGVIGCGPPARNQHIPALQINPDAELVAVCDLDVEALQQVSIGGVTTYTDVEEMIKTESLDSVHVCTPPQTRLKIAEIVIPHEINILFEKPLASSVSEAKRIAELATEYDVLASVVHNKLFTPHFRHARQQVDQGEVGDVIATDIIYSDDMDLTDTHRDAWVNELPGGEIGEGLPHRVYMTLEFCDGFGGVEAISCRNLADVGDVAFDGISIQMKNGNGDQLVTVRVLTNTISREELTIYGTEGELVVDNNLRSIRTSSFEDQTATGIIEESFGQAIQLMRGIFTNAVGFIKRVVYRKMNDNRGQQSDSHYVLIDRYLDSVQSGGNPPVTLEEGIDTIRVMETVDKMTSRNKANLQGQNNLE